MMNERDLEGIYDGAIEDEDTHLVFGDYPIHKRPENSLIDVVDPDGGVVALCGDYEQFTSQFHVMYSLFMWILNSLSDQQKQSLFEETGLTIVKVD